VAAPHQIGAQAAFGAARALMGIRRAQHARVAVEGGSPGPGGTGPPAQPQARARADIGRDEVLAAISSVPAAPVDGTGGPAGAHRAAGFKERLLSALEGASGPGVAGDGGRRLSDDTREILDFVSDLFEAFSNDPHLPADMKPRIARLESAVARASLTDPGVLGARDHVVQRFLNALDTMDASAKLEGGRSRLEEIVDPIIERIVRESETAPQPFDTAYDLLQSVLDVQRETFETNLARVVKMAEAQQRIVRERRAASRDGRQAGEATQKASQEWNVWLGRARRLTPGMQMELADRQDTPYRRVSLAWVGEDYNPFIFVNRRGEKEASFSLQELAMYLRRGLAVVRERTQLPLVDRAMYTVLHRVHGRIQHQATHDALTGLDNRRTFEEALARALGEARRNPDLEHALGYVTFTGLEGLGGEPEGDAARRALIGEAGRVLGSALGPDGVAARLEEGEFAFLVERCAARRLKRHIEQVRRKLDDARFELAGRRYFLKACIGVLCVTSEAGSEEAMERARECMRRAREAETRVHLEHFSGAGTAAPMMDWATLINRTLGRDGVALRYQTVQPSDPKEKPRYEVLLGIKDDADQPVPAAEFIAALEYYDQMAALDRWVIRNALQWMSANRRFVRRSGGFTLKLTGRSLEDDNMMEYILEQLTVTSVPPGKLCFELTQADLVGRLAEAGRLIRTLREFGCRFALAKFGGGGGVHEELQTLALDYLKIDGRYVSSIDSNEDDFAVVVSATHLAHASGLRAVAEFVEHEEAIEKLRELGVDFIQGMAVSAPDYLLALGDESAAGLGSAGEASRPKLAPAAGAGGRSNDGGDTGWSEELDAFFELDDLEAGASSAPAPGFAGAEARAGGGELAGERRDGVDEQSTGGTEPSRVAGEKTAALAEKDEVEKTLKF